MCPIRAAGNAGDEEKEYQQFDVLQAFVSMSTLPVMVGVGVEPIALADV